MTGQPAGKIALILAAERLCAQYGLHGPTLKQIREAANQKNRSAIQYHFGDREQLLQAVFQNRMSRINPRRHAMLHGLRAQSTPPGLRAFVEVWVWPPAEEIGPDEDQNYYLQFIAKASRLRELIGRMTGPGMLTSGLIEAHREMRRLLSYLPAPIAEARLAHANEMCVHTLASIESDYRGERDKLTLQVETLIDMITASLEAPVSQTCLQALSDTTKPGQRRA